MAYGLPQLVHPAAQHFAALVPCVISGPLAHWRPPSHRAGDEFGLHIVWSATGEGRGDGGAGAGGAALARACTSFAGFLSETTVMSPHACHTCGPSSQSHRQLTT